MIYFVNIDIELKLSIIVWRWDLKFVDCPTHKLHEINVQRIKMISQQDIVATS